MTQEVNRILFVEDEEIDIEFINRKFIRRHPEYECKIVSSINACVYQLLENKYNLIVSDFHLPDGDAFDVIQIANNAGIPTIIVTGQGSDKVAVELMKKGASDYVVKDKEAGEHMLVLPSIISSVFEMKRLKDHNEELVEMLRMKNQDLERFTYIVAHDLRSPIASAVGLMKIFDSYKGRLDGDFDKLLDFVGPISERMLGIINGIYQYTVMESKAIKFSVVDMGQAVEEAIQNLKERIENSSATIEVGSLHHAQADHVQMVQLFQNLIGNGIKYRGSKQPHISVSSRVHDGELIYTIKDNGIGIPTEHHQKIFEVFSRLHTSSSEYEGVGMGLTIVKRILERHNGRIWVESEPGVGSNFSFALKGK